MSGAMSTRQALDSEKEWRKAKRKEDPAIFLRPDRLLKRRIARRKKQTRKEGK